MAIVASAPGKVLITGGYLILERPNAGIVVSTNARFYCIVKPLHVEVKHESLALGWIDVKLSSPQLSRETTYKLCLKYSTLHCVSPSELKNCYVEQALQYSVAAAHALYGEDEKDLLYNLLFKGFDITILGSNDFYSFRSHIGELGLPLSQESLAALPSFSSVTFNKEKAVGQNCSPEVAKTGLGSSAAMTTAVVAALLHYLAVVDLSLISESKEPAGLHIVHTIAQCAHCMAQGKVGSGFDVSAAVYGSQHYVRFSPDVLSPAQISSKEMLLVDVVVDIISGKWNHEITSFSLPPHVTLLVGEPGSGGSSTPSMVGAVENWRKLDPETCRNIRRKLSQANLELANQLNILSKLAEENFDLYEHVVDRCSTQRSPSWAELAIGSFEEAVVNGLLGSRYAMLEIRLCMRKMGEFSGIPIEPRSQTRLLDATMDLEGVLLAGIPGAGGFDAIFALALGNSSASVMKAWTSLNVLPMLVRGDPRGVLLESRDPRPTKSPFLPQ